MEIEFYVRVGKERKKAISTRKKDDEIVAFEVHVVRCLVP